MTIEGDLYLTEGIGQGDVSLENIRVNGKTYIRGGGENSIHIRKSKLGEVLVKKENNNIRLIIDENTDILNLLVNENTILVIKKGAKVASIKALGKCKIQIEEGAEVGKLEVESKDVEIKSVGKIGSIRSKEDLVINDKLYQKGKEIKMEDQLAVVPKPSPAPSPAPSPGPGSGTTPSPDPKPDPVVRVNGITLTPENLELTVGGEAKTIIATVSPTTATNKNITWISSDNAVATVANGLVTPISAGTTTIAATTADGGFSKETLVTVKAADLYVLATDADFSGETDGTFKYIGSAEYVEIPHVIKGVPVTSYNNMFEETSVKGVRSTNKNVINMNLMFYGSEAETLDLSNFDTSKVDNMSHMFVSSQATIGYARTQADAARFNASSNKPAGLNFVVK